MEVRLFSNSSFEKIVAITARKPSKSILSVKCFLFFFQIKQIVLHKCGKQ